MINAPIRILIASLSLMILPLASAQQKMDIVQILGRFVQASYAASRCIKPDQGTLSRFLCNFTMVSARATEELRKRNPGKSDQKILDGIKQRASATEKVIDEVIRARGCSDPMIQDLLKRFDIQANLKL